MLAGAYPTPPRDVAALLRAGVTAFVDLTEDGELEAYASLLPDGVAHERLPIVDLSRTTDERMRATLDAVDRGVAHGRLVYLHCRGGCGRTATVAACWLVRHGAEPIDALERVGAAARTALSDRCPETDEQRSMVLGWRPGA